MLISSSTFCKALPLSIAVSASAIPCSKVATLSPAINAAAAFISTISRCAPFLPDKMLRNKSALSLALPPFKLSGLAHG